MSKHAFRRLRERWAVEERMTKRELVEHLASSIEKAEMAGRCINTPGGTYVPFSLDGTAGFLVVKEDCVVTVVPEEWAQEVASLLEELNGPV